MFVGSRDIFPDADMVICFFTVELAVLLHSRSGENIYKCYVVKDEGVKSKVEFLLFSVGLLDQPVKWKCNKVVQKYEDRNEQQQYVNKHLSFKPRAKQY